jgi:DNA polymerase eta
VEIGQNTKAMSSSPAFQSSPFPTARRKSQFTYKHLSQLAQSTATCPLRVIAHVDLDAFYAQCEMVRLGVPDDQPLAVQQWQALIAVNYPARPFGVTRHITASEAQKKCPDIILQHVATWKEGEDKWAYHDDAYKHIATHKVSLDPYRMESKKIFAAVTEALPAPPLQKVEKAGIDELFLDLSAQIHSILLERYPELQGPPPYDDPTEHLPRPPTTALDWDTDALIDLDEQETEDDDPDWDDIVMLVGSEIVRSVRAAVRQKLKYTCSAGLSRNKMLAKLGSGHMKPNGQTVIRNRAVQHFLSEFKFTKIRGMGGKLGDEVVGRFGTDLVKDLLKHPIEELEKQLGNDGTGTWLWGLIRGEDLSEVNPRTQIKSMLSAKSFTHKVDNIQTASRWLRIFVADIYSRCVDEGVLEHKRRPKTITLHHRSRQVTRSKQTTVPQGSKITEDLLFELAKKLLVEMVASGHAWPCSNLSLSVGGFEDTTRSKGIGNFLVHGEEAKALRESERQRSEARQVTDDHQQPPSKRQKLESSGIQKFFVPRDDSKGEEADEFIDPDHDDTTLHEQQDGLAHEHDDVLFASDEPPPSAQPATHHHPASPSKHDASLRQKTLESYFCSRCNAHLPLDGKFEHEDWHVAKDLSEEWSAQERQSGDSAEASVPHRPSTPGQTKQQHGKGRGRPPGNSSKVSEKGQTKLAFGKS